MASEEDGKNEMILQKFEIVDTTSPRRKMNKVMMLCLKLFITLFVLLILLFVGVPVIFYYCTSLQRLVFLKLYDNLRNNDFSDPRTSEMLPGTRNLYIPVGTENDKIGVWHILSNKSMDELGESSNQIADSSFDSTLKNNTQITFIYLHGVSDTRAATHHIELYKVLRSRGHVLALDYRGYADSTDRPLTENQMLEDALAVYNWLLNKEPEYGWIIIWGHSLGTAVAIKLCPLISKPKNLMALVLEAPFTNMAEEVRRHPLSKFFSWLPYFEKLIIKPFEGLPFAFKSDENIEKLNVDKLAIVHAKNDEIVPYEMGEMMYNLAKKYDVARNVTLISFDKGGHDDICLWQPDFENEVIEKYVDGIIK